MFDNSDIKLVCIILFNGKSKFKKDLRKKIMLCYLRIENPTSNSSQNSTYHSPHLICTRKHIVVKVFLFRIVTTTKRIYDKQRHVKVKITSIVNSQQISILTWS